MTIIGSSQHRKSGRRRLAAAWTLLPYVVCGLTLTAHIALADHHCRDHCEAEPVPASAGLLGDACDFHHHAMEEHHEEAVGKPGSHKTGPGMTPTPRPLIAPDTPCVTADTNPVVIVRDTSGAPPPSRAPPASLPV
ncbi:hypothetical protein H8E07_17405 [bacterium]|nr:hypothetical protein [bacterium]